MKTRINRAILSRECLALILSISFILANMVPVFGETVDEQIKIELSSEQKEATTKNIQKIQFIGTNQWEDDRLFNLVLALVDYKGHIISFVSEEEFIKGKDDSNLTVYTKILPEGYKLKVFALDDLTSRNLISNVVEIPIVDGHIVEEIASIEPLDVEISQWSDYELPKEIEAKMNTGVTKNIPVKWDIDKVDTFKAGEFIIEGQVDGYKGEKVVLELSIIGVEKIIDIEDISITIDQGDEFLLPSHIEAKMSTGKKKEVPVIWDGEEINTEEIGEFTFEGTVEGYEKKVILTLIINEFNIEDIVVFENEELEYIIRDESEIESEDITKGDLLEVTSLYLPWALYGDLNIEDLKYLKNLQTLDLSFYETDFDLSSLSKLKKLEELNLFGNKISDLRGLEGLINLRSLDLANNNISDLTPLRNLTNLTKLRLNDNGSITDIKALANLVNLTELSLPKDSIKDYTPTAKYYESLNNPEFTFELLEADEEGVITLNASIGDKFNLPYGIKLHDGTIEYVNWDKEEIIITKNESIKVEGQVVDSDQCVYVELVVGDINDNTIIEFPDKNLEKAVRQAIDKYKGDIYYKDVKNLKKLETLGLQVKDLTGIENLSGLEELWLWGNMIGNSQLFHIKKLTNLVRLDLSMTGLTYIPDYAFNGLDRLEELYLNENMINEIEKDAFYGLNNLIHLDMDENYISNIEAIRNLPNLKELYMRYNDIRDISPVEDLKNLTLLWASNNKIEDVSPLSDLMELNWIRIADNNIKDISSLSSLSKVTKLSIENNEVKSLNGIESMKDIDWLEAQNNQIENIDPISDKTELTLLNLANNKITNIEALKNTIKLTQLYLKGNHITDFSPIQDYYSNLKVKDFELIVPEN
ncbi:leucine-rich repeat domain-containing protein [Tissierella sp. MSJ-40]|uniref:Leucine-rich repeat domain-containing protein n=1 Tax=Tissierella simiarum TaxID=2841534 RepID=A0ABS6E3F4_9FIRM|nr:leucine-rich repeat domain-containing protein [Tissierella simiarum]MBU5436975.1 leucine-rich repeat domain-containing protein [Tissierella simiarum]